MINEQFNYTPQRLQSQVVSDPTQDYQSWIQDWQNRYNAEAGKAGSGAGPSLQQLVANYANQNSSNTLATGSSLFGTDQSKSGTLSSGLDNIYQSAVDAARSGNSSDYTPYAITDLGQDTFNSLVNYQPSSGYVPDFSALNAEKDKMNGMFATEINNQKSLQNAYTSQLGGGYAGGVLPDPSQAFAVAQVGQTDPTTGQPTAGSAGQPATTMPWATPSYNSGGLGGLGGYNPNPWNTSGTSAAQTSNPWGGPFGAKNPYAPGN